MKLVRMTSHSFVSRIRSVANAWEASSNVAAGGLLAWFLSRVLTKQRRRERYGTIHHRRS